MKTRVVAFAFDLWYLLHIRVVHDFTLLTYFSSLCSIPICLCLFVFLVHISPQSFSLGIISNCHFTLTLVSQCLSQLHSHFLHSSYSYSSHAQMLSVFPSLLVLLCLLQLNTRLNTRFVRRMYYIPAVFYWLL